MPSQQEQQSAFLPGPHSAHHHHRLILVPAQDPLHLFVSRSSRAAKQSALVRQTEFYSGLHAIQRKITLFLGPKPQDRPISAATGQTNGAGGPGDGSSGSMTVPLEAGRAVYAGWSISYEGLRPSFGELKMYLMRRTRTLRQGRQPCAHRTTTPAPASPTTISRAGDARSRKHQYRYNVDRCAARRGRDA